MPFLNPIWHFEWPLTEEYRAHLLGFVTFSSLLFHVGMNTKKYLQIQFHKALNVFVCE